MNGLRMFLELRKCKARSNSVSEGSKKPFSRYHSSGERLFIYYESVAKELYYKVYVPAHRDL